MEVDYRPFYARVNAEKEEIRAALKTTVRWWTQKEMDAGHNPTFDQFVDYYPEWDHEELHRIIGEEMYSVKHGLPGACQAIQGA